MGRRGDSAKAEEGEPEEPAPLPGEGTPDGDRLRQAHRAFEAGDYVLVRELCGALSGAEDTEVSAAAAALAKRTGVDPVQIGVLVACLVFFLVITYVYALR